MSLIAILEPVFVVVGCVYLVVGLHKAYTHKSPLLILIWPVYLWPSD